MGLSTHSFGLPTRIEFGGGVIGGVAIPRLRNLEGVEPEDFESL